jgi:FkbM family methyltransferase
MNPLSVRQKLVNSVVGLGPRSRVVQLILKAACARHGTGVRFSEGWIDVHRKNQCLRIALHQFPYVADIAAHFDSYFGQLVPRREGTHLVVDCSTPRLQRYRDSGLEFELASLPEESEAIESYFRWYKPKAGDLLFDVGAYCGVSTYSLSKMTGEKGRVVAFEPDPIAFQLLQLNIRRHGLTNVNPVNVALGAELGVAEFCSEGNLGSGLSSAMSRASTGKVCHVETITLEEACSRFGVPSFVKIDIEGAEIALLNAARDFLSKHTLCLVIDTNHWIQGTKTNVGVEQLLKKCGYVVESSDQSGFMTTWAAKTPSQEGSIQHHAR